MNCDECREGVSARLDGEDPDGGAPAVRGLDVHLQGCAGCRAWQERAVVVTRAVRVQPATRTPDLAAVILAAAAADTAASAGPAPAVRRPRRVLDVAGRWTGLRVVLAGIGFVQICLALAQLLGVDQFGHQGAAGVHLLHESSAWGMGLAVGFLVVAARPGLARGLLPALGVFVAVLTVVSVGDVLGGQVDAERLVGHAGIVVALVVVALLDRAQPRHPRPGAAGLSAGGDPWSASPAPDTAGIPPAQSGGQVPGRWLRPAGRRAA